MEKAKPSFGYLPLALMLTNKDFGNNLVITTNFDNLIEKALFIYANKHPIVINHESMAEFAKNKGINRPIIAKVHRGLYYKPLNSQNETNKLMGDWRKVLEKLFETFTPIVIGYGGGDGSLMSLLEEEGLAEKIYWCYRESSGLPDKRVQRLIQRKRNGFLVKTAGFDALMLAIGNEFFENEIDTAKVESYLKAQTDERVKEYNEQYKKLLEEKKDSAKSETSESEKKLEEDIIKLDETVRKSEMKRDIEGKLTAWDYIRMGIRAYDEGKYDKAIEYYSKAIELKPDFAEAYGNRGNIYRQIGNYDQAIADCSKAIELNPDFVGAYYNRGAAYEQSGYYGKAEADFKMAEKLRRQQNN